MKYVCAAYIFKHLLTTSPTPRCILQTIKKCTFYEKRGEGLAPEQLVWRPRRDFLFCLPLNPNVIKILPKNGFWQELHWIDVPPFSIGFIMDREHRDKNLIPRRLATSASFLDAFSANRVLGFSETLLSWVIEFSSRIFSKSSQFRPPNLTNIAIFPCRFRLFRQL